MTESNPRQSGFSELASTAMRRLGEVLFPGNAERDPAFRAEIERLSVRSLYIIAAVCVMLPALGLLFHSFAEHFEPRPARAPTEVPLFFLIALALIGAARSRWGRRNARRIAFAAGLTCALLLTWLQFALRPYGQAAQIYSMTDIVVVLLVAVASVPALPLQMFSMGAFIILGHYVLTLVAIRQGLASGYSLHDYAGLDLIVLLATALSALKYRALTESFQLHQREMAAQSRLLISDNAALLGRFSATLSHELNSPLGALGSGLETLRAVDRRLETAATEERPRLLSLRRDLYENTRLALDHLRSTVARMQRFTHLDRSEVAQADLEQLLKDVAEAARHYDGGEAVRIDLSLEPLPRVRVRPQQISAVFSKLLDHALKASSGEGPVTVRARRQNGAVEVRVRDRGPRLEPQRAAELFEPDFEVKNGRVAAANWGLFSSRQIVQEHGGDIELHSPPEGGAEFVVRLPVDREAA